MALIINMVKYMRAHGIIRFAAYSFYRLYDLLMLGLDGILPDMRGTSANVSERALGFGNPEFHAHDPTESYWAFSRIMNKYVRPGREDVLLDYGCGLGRILLMGGTYPFRKIIGIEISEELSAGARRIVEHARRQLKCQDIQIVTADASIYEVPPCVNVVYFFNPFHGQVLESVICRLRQSLLDCPRRLRIIYYSPARFEEAVSGCDWLDKKGEMSFPAISPKRFAIYETRVEFERVAETAKAADPATPGPVLSPSHEHGRMSNYR